MGLQSVLWDKAVKSNGADADRHRRDLWDAIDRGDYPAWDLGVELFDQILRTVLPLTCSTPRN